MQRPQAYREAVLASGGAEAVLSVWAASVGLPAVLFLPGTMTHPLFYEELPNALQPQDRRPLHKYPGQPPIPALGCSSIERTISGRWRRGAEVRVQDVVVAAAFAGGTATVM